MIFIITKIIGTRLWLKLQNWINVWFWKSRNFIHFLFCSISWCAKSQMRFNVFWVNINIAIIAFDAVACVMTFINMILNKNFCNPQMTNITWCACLPTITNWNSIIMTRTTTLMIIQNYIHHIIRSISEAFELIISQIFLININSTNHFGHNLDLRNSINLSFFRIFNFSPNLVFIIFLYDRLTNKTFNFNSFCFVMTFGIMIFMSIERKFIFYSFWTTTTNCTTWYIMLNLRILFVTCTRTNMSAFHSSAIWNRTRIHAFRERWTTIIL